ncbi:MULTISPECIES: hypothetical protein [Methylobacterium]|jgi:hypothetical protein|uniref:Uncharacterized protein n=2 Tax=Methylobacterium TaxID=407 RepID=A0A2R4WM61_9HYPH|nr:MULTISPECIES: hypothetical protein [Methylobacterium]MBZ6411072.1 hypothetical protein [Methylobacterium sp.]AWB22585.1 hypothetical protein DA075_18100 [Methylobacterium currus]MBK3397137.1 hypothetical protein [Methylobacterium ajmalii]MBK3408352.1 hypothetical protein [Methylobacterium ajmalii]MBK3421168.1 hypothetical protein [Methylobacterium ajmalii]
MRWWREGDTVRWTLTCLDESDPKGRPPDMATYRGVSKLEDGFLEGHVRDAPIPGRFVLAWRGLAPYWQLWLDACPARGGSPVIRKVR